MSHYVKSLSNVQYALVTGAGRRVGLVIAQALARDGWRILLHARTQADADAALGTLSGASHCAFGADLSDLAGVDELAAWVIEKSGGELSLLVNNASTFTQGAPEETTAHIWSMAMDVNARAPLFLASACLPALRAAGGIVINLGDRSPGEAWPSRAAHAASKAALAAISACSDTAWAPAVRTHHLDLSLVMPPDGSPAALLSLTDAEGNGWTGPEAAAEQILKIASRSADTDFE